MLIEERDEEVFKRNRNKWKFLIGCVGMKLSSIHPSFTLPRQLSTQLVRNLGVNFEDWIASCRILLDPDVAYSRWLFGARHTSRTALVTTLRGPPRQGQTWGTRFKFTRKSFPVNRVKEVYLSIWRFHISFFKSPLSLDNIHRRLK